MYYAFSVAGFHFDPFILIVYGVDFVSESEIQLPRADETGAEKDKQA